MGEPSDESRIIATARQLFAAFGYDGTSSEMIAEAAGADPGEIAAEGGRRGLYLRVLEDFFQRQNALMDEVERNFTPDEKGIRYYLDRIIDFYVENPSGVAVWQHRRMSDAADMADVEERYQTPLFRRSLEIVGPSIARHPDYEMVGMVVNYCVQGFSLGGFPRFDGTLLDADDPEGRRRFRAHMHRLQDLIFRDGFMSDPPDPPTGA